MTKNNKYLVALDVGSTKTCAVICEPNELGVKFVSMGAAESKGLRKGLIANIGAAATSIRRAVEEAEGVAGVPVERAIVGVAGSHLRGVNSRGGVTLGHRPRDIQRDDVRNAVDAAR
ncbi:MAG: cell division protein FtsA, partial [Bryobacteraceae bacterium]